MCGRLYCSLYNDVNVYGGTTHVNPRMPRRNATEVCDKELEENGEMTAVIVDLEEAPSAGGDLRMKNVRPLLFNCISRMLAWT